MNMWEEKVACEALNRSLPIHLLSRLFQPATYCPCPALPQALTEAAAELSATGASQEYRTGVPGWHTVVAAFARAAEHSAAWEQRLQAQRSQGAGQKRQQEQREWEAVVQEFSQGLEGAVAAALVWAQSARPPEAEAAAAPGQAEAAAGAMDEDAEEPVPPPSEPIPSLLQSLERRMGVAKVEEVCSHAASALAALAAAAGAPSGADRAAELAAALGLLAPMLRMLRASLRQLGLRYLAAHKATAKLSYVAASLFAGLVQEGFCMPDGADAGEPQPCPVVATNGWGGAGWSPALLYIKAPCGWEGWVLTEWGFGLTCVQGRAARARAR